MAGMLCFFYIMSAVNTALLKHIQQNLKISELEEKLKIITSVLIKNGLLNETFTIK